METDETTPEGQQETSSSEEDQTTPEASEGEKTPEEKGDIPYERFKEVVEEKNQLKTDLETLKGDIDTLKQQQPKEEETEPSTWKEAEDRAVKRATTQIKDEITQTLEEEREQEKSIEKSFGQLQSMGQEITPEVKKIVLTKMIETGNEDVFGVYLSAKDEIAKVQKGEQIKQEGFIPTSQKGAEAEKPAFSYQSIHGKSPMDILKEQGE